MNIGYKWWLKMTGFDKDFDMWTVIISPQYEAIPTKGWQKHMINFVKLLNNYTMGLKICKESHRSYLGT